MEKYSIVIWVRNGLLQLGAYEYGDSCKYLYISDYPPPRDLIQLLPINYLES